MTTQEIKRKLTAILSADVKGYSRLMGEDEEWTVHTLNTYKDMMSGLRHQHRGRVVDVPGDNVLAELASVVDAVQCSVEIQQVLRAKNAMLPVSRRMEFRIGINLGDVIEEGEQIYGDWIHLWSERYDRDLKDFFVLQDEIARQIMTALQAKLTEGEYASGVAGTTSNLKALECFWRAEERFFHFAKEDNAAARQWAQKAVELDPKFAGAWALMGWTHLWDVIYGWTLSPVQSMERALEYGQKATGLSDSCTKANALMGYINLLSRKFDEAIEKGEKAVRINPNDPMMLTILAGIMYFNGRFNEAIALLKNAMRLCSYYPANFLVVLSMSYFLAGRYEEALAAGELLLARAQKGEYSLLLAHSSLAKAYIGLGQGQKARAHAEEMLKINPNYSLANVQKRYYFYRDPAHLERHIDALRKAGLK
jgi:adenylate cyclase